MQFLEGGGGGGICPKCPILDPPLNTETKGKIRPVINFCQHRNYHVNCHGQLTSQIMHEDVSINETHSVIAAKPIVTC